jgi:hypothetical protein
MSERCPHCSRTFADDNGLFCHINERHGRKLARAAVPKHPSVIRENVRTRNAAHRAANKRDEPNMADIVIEAQIARAMGEPVDPDIAEMFDV